MTLDRDLVRQLALVATYAVTVFVNGAAVALPLNGLDTREISDRFPALVVPANYVFSIWSVIYTALLAFTLVQALPDRRRDPRLRRLGYLPALTGVLNALWVVLWHFEVFALTVPVMVALLVTLIAIHRRLREQPVESWVDRVLVVAPWSLYLGWITVATIANISQMLLWAGFTGGGIPQEVWALAVLGVGVVIAARVVTRRRDAVYGAVIVWAYLGIAAKQDARLADVGAVGGAAIVGLLALAVLADRVRRSAPTRRATA